MKPEPRNVLISLTLYRCTTRTTNGRLAFFVLINSLFLALSKFCLEEKKSNLLLEKSTQSVVPALAVRRYEVEKQYYKYQQPVNFAW